MRTLIIISALLAAAAANAEPKRSAKDAVKPLDVKATQVVAPEFQPKAIELATPELEIKSRDVSDAALDKKLEKRRAKSGEASVLREPAQLKLDDAVATPASTAPASATTANKP